MAANLPQRTDKTPVWIVVLHWQASHYTRACLASIRALSYKNYRVLLVDNGSSDNAGAGIAKQFPEVEYLRIEENVGFAAGCNHGIEYCLESGAEWIWLLNNDTKVAADSLELMMEAASRNPQAGILGAMVYTGEGEQFVASGIGEIDFTRAKTYLRKQVPDGVQVMPCEWLTGANMLLRADAIQQVGLFDEDYFIYFEDTDLSYRMARAGWHCLLVPNARVEHVGTSTDGGKTSWRAYYYTRNRLLFFLRYQHGFTALPALVAIYGHLFRHAMVLPFRGDHGRQQLKAEYMGLRDYHSRRLGKCESIKD
jgi:GT2 family glycosyltransferase